VRKQSIRLAKRSGASRANERPVFSAWAACSFLSPVGDGEMSPNQNRFVSTHREQPPAADLAAARRAQERLRASSFRAIRGLTCDVHEGMLTLRGQLPNFYTKQVALSLLANLEGVEEITDRVEVV
jgi:osmotically-inducible protein OsmY